MKDILDLYYKLCKEHSWWNKDSIIKEIEYHLYYGEKEYKCFLCGKVLNTYVQLRKHNGLKHKEKRTSDQLFVEFWLNEEWPECLGECGKKIIEPKPPVLN